jgi:hypothetical protein
VLCAGVDACPNAGRPKAGVEGCPNADVGAVGAFKKGFAVEVFAAAGADAGACENGFELELEVGAGAVPFARSIRFGWTLAPSSI